MGLENLLSLLRGDHTLQRLSQEVARRCEARIWDRASSGALDLPQNEARGYIRARSGLLLAEESRRILQEQPLRGVRVERLIEAAAQLSTDQVAKRLASVRQARRAVRNQLRAA